MRPIFTLCLRRLTGRLAAAAVVVALTACGQEATSPAEDESEYWTTVPMHFANLQVLPETIERDELILYMRTISRSLGVRCAHCHDMSEDYATDDVAAKIVAREMMRLVGEFNALTSQRPDATAVTCYMCHRGTAKPSVVDLPLHSDA